MEVLLTGNTAYVTEAFIKAAFPSDHVLVTKNTDSSFIDDRIGAVSLADGSVLEQLGESYQFDTVVYFSEYLSPTPELEGDIDRLRRILRGCCPYAVRFIYIGGTEGAPSAAVDNQMGTALLERSAEDLCRHYAGLGPLQLKIIRTPYLYARDSRLAPPAADALFSAAERGTLTFADGPEDPLYLLSIEDLGTLLRRILDAWTPEAETFTVPDAFGSRVRDLVDAVGALIPDVAVAYGDVPVPPPPADDGVLSRRFGWQPTHSFVEDVPGLFEVWRAGRVARPNIFVRAWSHLGGAAPALAAVEVLVLWAVAELMARLTASSQVASVLDARLLLVVLAATVHGMNAGLLAAALASVGLAATFVVQEGCTLATLFYEPSNWLPFIAYFVVGAACGYVQLRHRDELAFARTENEGLRSRLAFVNDLYRDTLEGKREFRRQILGRRDSFGKIFAVTRELDLIKPQEIFRKTILVLEDVLENRTVSLYRVVGEGAFARLAAAAPGIEADVPRSIRLDEIAGVLDVVEQGGVWVNRELSEDLPMFAYAVRRAGRPAVLIFISEAEPEQMTLYYQNLFRILCGLIETALMRAFDYDAAIHDTRFIPDTRILLEVPFKEELSCARDLKEARMARHLLMRVVPGDQGRAELRRRVQGAVRDSDLIGEVAGELYLLLQQAGERELPIIADRLERAGITAEPVDDAAQERLLAAAGDAV